MLQTHLRSPMSADAVLRKVMNFRCFTSYQILTLAWWIVWGVLWLVIAIIFFAAGILVGLAAFKESAQQQKEDASHFLPVPGSKSGAASMAIPSGFAMLTVLGLSAFLGW